MTTPQNPKANPSSIGDGDQRVSGPFSVRIVTPEGELRIPLEAFAKGHLAEALPVRQSLVFPNQRNMPGKSFAKTNGDFVAYESLLERDWILIKDFDTRVTRILEQPFELEFELGGRKSRHIPDLLLWHADSLVVCDVKPLSRSSEERFVLQAEATKWACSYLGWGFEVLTEPDPMFMSNLRWLGGYRDEPIDWSGERSRVLNQVAQGPSTIGELLSGAVEPLMTRPILMHLLWTQTIRIDLGSEMNDESVVRSQ